MRLKVLVTLLVLSELLLLEGVSSSREVSPPASTASLEKRVESSSWTEGCTTVPPREFSSLLGEASTEYKIDPLVLAATVHRESGCDKWALGSSGEIGLAQIHPGVWVQTLKKEGLLERSQELWDPETNLRAAAYILGRIQKRTPLSEGLTGVFRRYNGNGSKARKYALEQTLYHQRLVSLQGREES